MSAVMGTLGLVAADSGPATFALIASVVAAAMLTVGVFLARSHRFGAHRWVQTTAVIINLVGVLWMVRSYIDNVADDLPDNLDEPVNVLTTVHGVVGAIAVVLGVFLVVRGNQLMARGESLARYKTAMRVAYVFYLLAAVLGVTVFFSIYD